MTQIDIAKYKPIPNYSRYLINESGDVWDTQRNIVMPQTVNGGYKCTNLYREGGKKVLEKVHRLVAYTYLTKPENAANHVVHIDTDRMNNHYTNLRWKIKGEVDDSALTYSTLGGVRYSIRQLDDYAKATGLPIWTVRNRLEDKWTLEEMLQGHKNSDVYCVDGVRLIGEVAVHKYQKEQARLWKEKLRKHREELYAAKKTKAAEIQNALIEKRGTDNPEVVSRARSTWKGMMDRCYDIARRDYRKYGAKGVRVCGEWLDQDNFCGWYIKNKIADWDMDKDFLQDGVPTNKKVYSPSTCCFVPKYLNQWFVKRGLPTIHTVGEQFYIEIYSRVELFPLRKRLVGDSVEDVLEQWYLFKELQLEKRVLKMFSEYENIKQDYPNSPEIHPTLIGLLSAFSMEKYLSS